MLDTNTTIHTTRNFLFLQGPHGPFFRLLGTALSKHGHNIFRINFNGGDWVDWPSFRSFSYKHSFDMWREWVYNFAKHNNITDLVLYGDCRPAHKIAIQELRKLSITIHVFEEGYIRPHWVTYEQSGVNGYSRIITKDLDEILNAPEYTCHAEPQFIKIEHNTRYMLRYCVRYYFFKWLGLLFFPKYRTHRQLNSFYEALIWIKRYVVLSYVRKKAAKKTQELIESQDKYFLFLMQLNSDFQITEHSNIQSMQNALLGVIYSFANHAAKDYKLVIKNHPFDNGSNNYNKFIRNISNELDLNNRLMYMDGGNLPQLLDHSIGVVTVNSTAGLQAIHHNKPTKILGNAVYDRKPLVNQCPLDLFWSHYSSPDQQYYKRFRHYLLIHNQLNGSFYEPSGIEVLLKVSVDKLLG